VLASVHRVDHAARNSPWLRIQVDHAMIIRTFVNLMMALTLAALTFRPAMAEELPADQPSRAEVVTVGFYPVNIYGVDMSTSTFNYDGYVWFRWRGEIDPTETLEFINAVDKSSISKEFLYDEPQIMPDGQKYQIMRIESQFFKPFPMADFPLDKHELTITIEDSLRGIDQLVYEIDQADTRFSRNLAIAGWKLNGWKSSTSINDYGSNFGDTGAAQASRFAQLNFSVKIARPESYFVWKLLLPLIIVLCGAWIALLLNPILTETRAALPASALLTTVFLQQSYNGALPETGGLVLLDKIYVTGYILIVLTLARVIINSRRVEEMNESEINVLRNRDVVALGVQALIFAVVTCFIIFAR
jgi:hypothetical protein